MTTHTIDIDGQHFTFHPSGAGFWVEQQMLLVADVHLGKVTHFRKYGIAVPKNVARQNFERLNAAISHFRPKKVCFLGDLFHSFINSEWQLFEAWVKSTDATFTLITGNHDIIPRRRYEGLGFCTEDVLHVAHFSLTHHPEEMNEGFNICGHVHPGIRLKGKGKQSLALPCFFLSPKQLILPAFGSFTGKHLLKPTKEDHVFVIAENRVIAFNPT